MYRACLDCGEISKRRRCSRCESARNIARGSSHSRGYTRHHRDLAARYLRLHPSCELRLPGCELVAADADHVTPLRAGGPSTWRNYQAACRPCHRQKTRQDAKEYAR